MIGSTIRMYRIMNRYTQEQLSERVEIKQRTISNIERGLRRVRADELEKFAKVFHCKVTDLLMSSQIHSTHKKEEEKKC